MADNPFVWQMVKEAVINLGGRASNSDIKKYIKSKYEKVNETTINCSILTCSVNKDSRVNWPENSKPRLAVSQYDFLYNVGRGQVELYNEEKHGKWEIRQGSDDKLKVCKVDESNTNSYKNDPISETINQNSNEAELRNSEDMNFAMENHLRDFIAKNITSLNIDGKGLRLYVDNNDAVGIEYQTGIGRIDLLAVDDDNNFVVLELKVGKGADYAIGQILRYMGWVKSKLCSDNTVKGIIVAPEIDDRLKYAASMVNDITLYKYQVNFSVEKVSLLS